MPFSLKRTSRPARRKMMARRGKKAKAGAKANRLLKAECVRLGIYTCELGYEGCTRNNFLSFAHVAKRRELKAGELETAAILACWSCHRRLDEGMSHADMRVEVERCWLAGLTGLWRSHDHGTGQGDY